MWIIYKVIFADGKVYIGQTSKTLEQRKKEHFRDARYELTKSKNNKFHNAILQHEPLEWLIIDEAESYEAALLKEAEYIEKFNAVKAGYNCRTAQNGPCTLSDESKRRIAISVSKHGLKHWANNTKRKTALSKVMKEKHKNGEMNEAKVRSAAARRSPEQRELTSKLSSERYKDIAAKNKMAEALGGKPFLVYKKDGTFVGRFVSIREAYRQLQIPNNGHISTILRKGKGTLYGYLFVYEKPILDNGG